MIATMVAMLAMGAIEVIACGRLHRASTSNITCRVRSASLTTDAIFIQISRDFRNKGNRLKFSTIWHDERIKFCILFSWTSIWLIMVRNCAPSFYANFFNIFVVSFNFWPRYWCMGVIFTPLPFLAARMYAWDSYYVMPLCVCCTRVHFEWIRQSPVLLETLRGQTFKICTSLLESLAKCPVRSDAPVEAGNEWGPENENRRVVGGAELEGDSHSSPRFVHLRFRPRSPLFDPIVHLKVYIRDISTKISFLKNPSSLPVEAAKTRNCASD